MKKIELVYKEILDRLIENQIKVSTQSCLAKTLKISLSTVNHALSYLKQMNAIKVKPNSFEIISPKKILLYWASIRNLEKDIVYKTRSPLEITQIEKNMPNNVIYAAYSAYKFLFKNMPADYSEVYIYSDEDNLKQIKKRFPETKNQPNLFILKKEFDKMSQSLLFVDLWNLKQWYAKDFLKAMEEKLHGILE